MKVLQERYMHQETVGDEFFTILCLHFGSGDLVSAGDIVMEVETSKAVLEIDADADGIIEYRCKAGDELRNGALLFVLYDPQGYRPGSDDDGLRDMDDPHPPAVLRPLFSKKALALIRENDIPESKFKGRDVVTREDVERLISEPASAPDSAERKPVTPVVCDRRDGDRPADKDSVYRVTLPPSKKTEIKYLSKVQAAGMNSALHMHVNVEGLFSFINNYFDVLKDTLLPIVVYETSRLLNTYKEFNAYYADGQIAYYRSVNIGVAVDIDDGLKVLTIPDTDKLLPRQIEAALSERIDRYLQRKLKPDHITGSTFTISDLSSQGLSCFQPLINKDQSAILGISGVDEKLGRSTLSLVFDHRVTEGMRACQFLNELKERVESYLPSPGRVDGSSHTEPDHRSASPAATSIRCHRCLKTLAEDQALQGPGLIKAILANGEETALCRDCMMGF